MAVPSCNVDKAHFQQLHSERNASNKETISTIYIANAKGILMNAPFCYSEKISREVSEGIVKYGDKLMSNAMAESDDDDDEMEELNQMGDDMQAMENSTSLELTIDTSRDSEEFLGPARNLYPLPAKGFHRNKASVNQFSKGLEEIRDYLKMRAYQGFSASIVLAGEVNEDGVVFGGQQTVPLEIIEGQIQNMLAGRGKQLAPMAVDLIMKDSEGQGVKVSTIKVNEDDVERFTIQA